MCVCVCVCVCVRPEKEVLNVHLCWRHSLRDLRFIRSVQSELNK